MKVFYFLVLLSLSTGAFAQKLSFFARAKSYEDCKTMAAKAGFDRISYGTSFVDGEIIDDACMVKGVVTAKILKSVGLKEELVGHMKNLLNEISTLESIHFGASQQFTKQFLAIILSLRASANDVLRMIDSSDLESSLSSLILAHKNAQQLYAAYQDDPAMYNFMFEWIPINETVEEVKKLKFEF